MESDAAIEALAVDLTTLTVKRIRSGTFMGHVNEATMAGVSTTLRVVLDSTTDRCLRACAVNP
ncbi:hypothetical protein GA0115260_1012911 [Streptomyces sp. MnatMP-M27]|uniref:hypothetical protein n=1 Tax=Streptomyces sp. MnatMP-M27 TaxID=1839768 RepID=UPI00081E7D63|nr:hypothetical protein [Streptomyces sp. MnatMP-M27]SCF69278.1 hypothetical protein GA0115260_1012911 [Streptomyces sp. MnatMP-M27]